MFWIFLIALGYVLGSIPFGLVIAKQLKGIDPRTAGSRNIGATNVARLCGTKIGIIALFFDLLKGVVPTLTAVTHGGGAFVVSLVALATVLGHIYPIFLGFKGGKAVATTIGVFLAISPLVTILAALSCAGVIAWSGYVSMGSLTLAVALPFFCLITGKWAFLPLALVLMAILFVRHRENIRRIGRGEENAWRKKKDA